MEKTRRDACKLCGLQCKAHMDGCSQCSYGCKIRPTTSSPSSSISSSSSFASSNNSRSVNSIIADSNKCFNLKELLFKKDATMTPTLDDILTDKRFSLEKLFGRSETIFPDLILTDDNILASENRIINVANDASSSTATPTSQCDNRNRTLANDAFSSTATPTSQCDSKNRRIAYDAFSSTATPTSQCDNKNRRLANDAFSSTTTPASQCDNENRRYPLGNQREQHMLCCCCGNPDCYHIEQFQSYLIQHKSAMHKYQ